MEWGIADEIVPEPEGGAHTDWEKTAALLRPRLEARLRMITERGFDPARRRARYRQLDGLFDA